MQGGWHSEKKTTIACVQPGQLHFLMLVSQRISFGMWQDIVLMPYSCMNALQLVSNSLSKVLMNGEQFGKKNFQPPQSSFPTTRAGVQTNIFSN